MNYLLFNDDMIRALLRKPPGNKTQTRRIIQSPDIGETPWCDDCPYGSPGSLLWVRECFIASLGVGGRDDRGEPINVIYRADDGPNERSAGPWSPSIHMPRWASRLTLRLTDVRVQRVQDISEDDARAEGIAGDYATTDPPPRHYYRRPDSRRQAFANLWNSLYVHDLRCVGWGHDPWVWALTFELIRANIDSID